jgi:hypothetical protein
MLYPKTSFSMQGIGLGSNSLVERARFKSCGKASNKCIEIVRGRTVEEDNSGDQALEVEALAEVKICAADLHDQNVQIHVVAVFLARHFVRCVVENHRLFLVAL